MIHLVFSSVNPLLAVGIGVLFSVLLSYILLSKFKKLLPTDRGREYVSQASESIGKPTGSGLFFVLSILFSAILFLPLTIASTFMYAIILAAMLFGYGDDRAHKPWHEYIKGLLDLFVSLSAALVFSFYFGTEVYIPFTGLTVTFPIFLFVLLATLLVWASINVTNCTDGVDGLASSLSVISLLAFLALSFFLETDGIWNSFTAITIGSLLVYLWFNTHPSTLLMGDAGSRGIGVILALSALYTKNPISFLFICLVFIVDGGAGIIKISLKRFLKISILKNIRTPIHDHLRESGSSGSDPSKKWKNQTLTIRFSLIHVLICSLYLFLEAVISGLR